MPSAAVVLGGILLLLLVLISLLSYFKVITWHKPKFFGGDKKESYRRDAEYDRVHDAYGRRW